MSQPAITISIVTYNTPTQQLSDCLKSICGTTLSFKCFIIDNARNKLTEKQIKEAQKSLPAPASLEYIPNDNTGYGKAHNVAIRKVLNTGLGRYHLAVNPDIYFMAGTLEKLTAFMDHNSDVALVMPRILYPDGSSQKLCKLLPTPGHLFARRFFPCFAKEHDALYQLDMADYNAPFECPSLSGCFMFLRTEVLREVGLFDERFFMYFEDVDLVRRIGQHYKTLYCPSSDVTHHYEKGSYSSVKLLLYHMVSGVKYFNKWGWLVDKQRTEINTETIRKLLRNEKSL